MSVAFGLVWLTPSPYHESSSCKVYIRSDVCASPSRYTVANWIMPASITGLSLKWVSNLCTHALAEHLDDPSNEETKILPTLCVRSKLGYPLGLLLYQLLLYSWKVMAARMFFSNAACSLSTCQTIYFVHLLHGWLLLDYL